MTVHHRSITARVDGMAPTANPGSSISVDSNWYVGDEFILSYPEVVKLSQ
jgi:hypothetical protein